MGIQGLTSYILNNSEHYLERYMLHDTYLIIDGFNIICQLYTQNDECNCAFGGDYDKYAECVRHFFDDLLKCNVIPLVIFDGAREDKKMKTAMFRCKRDTMIALNYTFSRVNRKKLFPLLIVEVFKNVMNEMGIKGAKCIFEADNTIAAVARSLNCPVLSYDSDFFIYGSLYILFNTLENRVPNPKGTGFVKRCMIYNIDTFFQAYNGLNQRLLYLAVVLLGNDCVKQSTFKKFFNHLPQISKRYNSEQHRRIDGVFEWLRRRTLNESIIEILSKMRKEKRKYILNIIETEINRYMNAPLDVLYTLGFSAEICFKASMKNLVETYKFEGDIYNLTYEEDETSETEQSDEEDKEDKEATGILTEKQLVANESLIHNLPVWFIDNFEQNRYPSYFLDVIIRNLYICYTQIEDPSAVSSIFASLKVISVIYAILISGVHKRKTDMEYITRNMNKGIQCFQLKYSDNILGCKLPSLLNLREISFVVKRDILNSTLGIYNARDINEIPYNWMLYLATLKYWIDQQQESFKFSCYIYALLFGMLFNIIDDNIGVYRVLTKFNRKFSNVIINIEKKRKSKNYEPQYPVETTIAAAVHAVNADDCTLAAKFFISNFETDKELYSQPMKYNIRIVNSFAEFQSCLSHVMHLNALLDYPYESIKLSTVYNGTLLYNLYNNFKKRDSIEAYINLILKNSPSLLHLFNTLLMKAKPLFKTALEKKN